MEKTSKPRRQRALLVAITIAVLALAWFGRDSLWRVAQAASAEAARLSAECRTD